MAKLTGAFVLRCWRARDDVCRIEVVRVGDGERTVFTTFDDASAWLQIQLTRSEPWQPDDRSALTGGGAT